MRLTTKSPRTGALVFLPLVLVFGCARAPEPPAPTSTPKPQPNLTAKQEKIVCVTLVNGKPMPSVDPIQLSRGEGHVAYWVYCGDGELKITLKDTAKDPFVGPFDNGGNHVRSSAVHPNAHYGLPFYRYTITLTTKDGVFTNDPDIDIMQ
jgi:hypothetical protein